MPRPYPFKIEVDDHRYRGDWYLCQGNMLCVRSLGFGSLIVELGGERPEVVAARTLELIVRTWQKNRADGLERQEREMEKIRRRNERERRP